MSRAKWKGPFVSNELLEQCKLNPKNVYTRSRNSTILPNFIGLTLNVHNGKNYLQVKVTENMIGYKLGEFCPTRKRFSFKKKKTK